MALLAAHAIALQTMQNQGLQLFAPLCTLLPIASAKLAEPSHKAIIVLPVSPEADLLQGSLR